MTTNAIEISAQATPNPNTLKFLVNTIFLETGTADFPNRSAAVGSPLAEALFALPQVEGVFVGANFITVSKAAETMWDDLASPIVDAIRNVLTSGVRVVANTTSSESEASHTNDIEQKIRDVLDREIRPAVAMDGGDITFHSYKDGIVTLHLRGACSSCPSSVMTLKMGVEHRLKEVIPEVREVVQV